MRELIACCGLDCEKCDAYIATKNNDDELRRKTAELWSELNNAPITPEMINCEGCRTEGQKTPFCESMCEIRKCAMEKCIETCGQCGSKDGCQSLNSFLANSPEAAENLSNV